MARSTPVSTPGTTSWRGITRWMLRGTAMTALGLALTGSSCGSKPEPEAKITHIDRTPVYRDGVQAQTHDELKAKTVLDTRDGGKFRLLTKAGVDCLTDPHTQLELRPEDGVAIRWQGGTGASHCSTHEQPTLETYQAGSMRWQITGTVFGIELVDDSVILRVFEGTVSAWSTAVNGPRVTVPAGQQTSTREGAGPSAPEAIKGLPDGACAALGQLGLAEDLLPAECGGATPTAGATSTPVASATPRVGSIALTAAPPEVNCADNALAQIVAVVADHNGTAIQGISVTFSVVGVSAGGGAGPPASFKPAKQDTNADGRAVTQLATDRANEGDRFRVTAEADGVSSSIDVTCVAKPVATPTENFLQ